MIVTGNKFLGTDNPGIRKVSGAIPESLNAPNLKIIFPLFLQDAIVNYSGDKIFRSIDSPCLINISSIIALDWYGFARSFDGGSGITQGEQLIM